MQLRASVSWFPSAGVLGVARWLALAPLLAASVAHAQAPGEVAPQPVAMPTQPLAPACAPCSCTPPSPEAAPEAAAIASVMANRWAIGLSLGSMAIGPGDNSDDRTNFSVGELALRYRATLRLEFELSVGGGRSQTMDNQQGDLEVNTAALAVRFRFNPLSDLNWFVSLGAGAASVANHEASSQVRDDATQPLGFAGIGIEWRLTHLAFQAEARAVELASRDRQVPALVTSDQAPMTTTASLPGQSGATVSLGVSYYF